MKFSIYIYRTWQRNNWLNSFTSDKKASHASIRCSDVSFNNITEKGSMDFPEISGLVRYVTRKGLGRFWEFRFSKGCKIFGCFLDQYSFATLRMTALSWNFYDMSGITHGTVGATVHASLVCSTLFKLGKAGACARWEFLLLECLNDYVIYIRRNEKSNFDIHLAWLNSYAWC